ncbi:MAG: hypothetical protein IJT16_09215 [Lachnospiraceae bacterium]|nr:hypothetical protein [Lachnospiraceae bacterium]
MGIGMHLENAELIASNEEDALKLMLQVLKKHHKKVLVTIDEITYSKDVAKFSHALSSYSNLDYDIYVLMTGLIDNIKNIKNKKSLTFLYRAKIVELDMLNITAISRDYQQTLGLDRQWAEELAYKTRGYSLAFQAVGFHYWNAICLCNDYKDINKTELDNQLDITLAELAYEKIWDELSPTDIHVLKGILELCEESGQQLIKVEAIRNRMEMTSDTFTKYRTRLIDSGILGGREYGYLKFKLPRFEEFMHSLSAE